MKDPFLRIKHWQLFILVFAIPFLFHMGFMGYMFSHIFAMEIDPKYGPEMDQMRSFVEPMIYYIFGMSFFVMLIMILWQGTIGLAFNERLPEEYQKSTNFFKVALIYPLIHMPFFMYGWYQGFLGNFNYIVFAVLGISHLFTMFCVFYNHYFAAKTLKSLQLGREAVFSDYIGFFFLFIINFVGVWIIQPRVNELAVDHTGNENIELV